MQNRGTNLIKAEKHVIPDDIASPLLETSTAVGVCVVAQDAPNKPLYFKVSKELGCTLEGFNQLQTAFKDNELLFSVQEFDEAPDEEDLQPFSLLEHEGKPVLLVFMEGNYDARRPAKATRSGEYYVAQLIRAKIAKIWKSAEVAGDVDKLMKYIAEDSEFDNDMNMYHVGRGSIIMIGVNAEIAKFGTNPNEEQFEWGYISKTLSEPAETAADLATASEPEVPASSFSLRGSTTPPAKPAAQTTAASQTKDVAAELKKAGATDTAIKTTLQKRKVMASPPSNMKGNKNALKKWYRSHGYKQLPDGYLNGVEVEIEIEEEVPLKDFQSLGAALGAGGASPQAAKPETKTAANNTAAPSTTSKLKNMFGGASSTRAEDPAPTPAATPEVAPAVVEPEKTLPAGDKTAPDNTIPVVPAGQKKDIATKFLPSVVIKKALDATSNAVPDPKTIQEVEKKYPDFMDQIGLEGGLERTYNWPHESRVLLCKEYPHAAALWIHSLIAANCELMILLDHKTGVKTEPEKVVEPEVKVEPEKKVATGGSKVSKLFSNM